jgi:PAS domain S-box-containing protein
MNKYNILVVEDEALIAANLVKILSSLGYTVYKPVATGEDAIRSVTTEQPDLVLMDIELIGAMTGIEAAEKIRAIADIPIVYLTAYTDDLRLGQARLTEPYGYIVKPAQSPELHATIEMAMYKHTLDRKLKESEERNRSIVQALPGFIFHFSADGRFIDCQFNKGDLLLLPPDQIIGKLVAEILPPDLAHLTERKIRETLDSGQLQTFEYSLTLHDQERFFEARMITRGINSVLAFIYDITERKRVEEALRNISAYTRSLIEVNLDALVTISPVGRITDVNAATEQITGYSREELIGTDFSDYFTEPEQAKEGYQRVFTDGTVRDYPLSIRNRDGHITPVLYNATVYLDVTGNVSGVFAAARDITERKKAEEALKNDRQRLANIIEGTRAGTWEWNVQTGETIFNEQWAEIIGYTLEEISPVSIETWMKYAHPDDLQKSEELLERHFLRESEWYEFESRMIHKKGHLVWVLDKGKVASWTDDGKPLWMFGTHQDITNQKRAEENLAAALKRVQEQQAAQAVISFSPALLLGDVNGFSIKLTEESSGVLGVERASVWLFDNNGEELRCIDLYESSHNRHSRDLILNYHEYVNEFEAVRTAKFIDAHDPLTDPRTAGYVNGYLKPNHITSMLDAVIRVSGQNLGVLCFEHVDRPHHWESDEIAFACQLADQIAITLLNHDRKRAEETLAESEKRYHNVVEDQTESICRFLPDGTHIFVNDAYCRYFDKKREEIIGHRFKPVLHPEDREIVARHIASITPEHPVIDVDQRIMMPDGGIRWQRWSDRAIFDQNGRVVEYQSVGRDITEQKELEKEMEYHAQELQGYSTSLATANKKLTLLSSITRHDINNQLTVLMGYLTLLEQKQPDPINTEYFLRVSNAAKRISAMIKFTKEYEEIGVHAPVWQDTRTLVDTAAKQVPLGMVVVKNDLHAGAEVFADPLVVKVFYNLMDNAVRYGGKITTIRFSASETGDDHMIVCEDDGDGIVAAEKERIFERGFGKNTGLGLALSREILDITGITIRETGGPGKGARFEITVPTGMWRMAGNGE